MDEKPKPDWSKIGKSSKRRGKSGERRIAKLLCDFTGKGFRKTPSSGGFNKQGGVKIAEHKFCGDVICDDPNFAFCVESKNRPDDFNLAALSTVPGSAEFTQWWFQTYDDAKRVKLLPLLYFKMGMSTNNVVKNDYLAFTKTVAEHLGFPRTAPHVRIIAYDEPVWAKAKVKIQGKAKKAEAKLLVSLPDPLLVSWIVFAKNVDPAKLFALPDWVEQETDKLVILDRSGPDGVLWQPEQSITKTDEGDQPEGEGASGADQAPGQYSSSADQESD
jgi:hypothetical protein